LLALLERWRGEAERKGRTIKRVVVAYEAGRDGFWLARWLQARGLEAYVIHPASVAVSRERKRAKTDRLDAAMLLRVLLGWLRGERGHCSMVAIPSLEEEDARRPSRERETLVGERARITNRIKSALIRLGIRSFNPLLRKAAQSLEKLQTAEGGPLPVNTLEEIKRDLARMAVVRAQIAAIETARVERLKQAPKAGPNAMLQLLARVIGIGIETADMLVREVLSRNLRDRRAVARYAGLTGSPDESGSRRREKGLSRAGNARVRRGMIQLSWRFLMFPEGKRACRVVPGTDGARQAGGQEKHDRGAGAQAPDRAVASRDDRRGAAGRVAAPGHLKERRHHLRFAFRRPGSRWAVDDRSEVAAIRARPWLQMPRSEWTRRLGALLAKRIPASWSGSSRSNRIQVWSAPGCATIAGSPRIECHRRVPDSLPACRRARGGQGQAPCRGGAVAPSLTAPARDGQRTCGRDGRMLAARVEQKNETENVDGLAVRADHEQRIALGRDCEAVKLDNGLAVRRIEIDILQLQKVLAIAIGVQRCESGPDASDLLSEDDLVRPAGLAIARLSVSQKAQSRPSSMTSRSAIASMRRAAPVIRVASSG
jgi:transposase